MTLPKLSKPKNDLDRTMNMQELQMLLQQNLDNKKLEIVSVHSTNLLSPGENYCSQMVKLCVTVCHKKNVELKKELHLVAKKSPSAANPILNWPLAFKKELFIYTSLMPMYRNIESKNGVEECDLIDVLPKYMGHRNSLKENGKIDDDSLLLMENLKTKGFYMMDRRIGLDFPHASKALKSLARYHAMGIAMKQKQPLIAQTAIEYGRIFPVNSTFHVQARDSVFRAFEGCSYLSKYLVVLEKSYEYVYRLLLQKTLPDDTWATITHGDFWVNNILFHKDKSDNVDNVKFVDFQTYNYNSALRDLPYFLCGSLDQTATNQHFDELLDIYYESFVQTLKRVDCDVRAFSRQSFDCELNKQAVNEFYVCATLIKFFLFEVEEKDQDNVDLHETVFKSDSSQLYREKLTKLVKLFESRNWISS